MINSSERIAEYLVRSSILWQIFGYQMVVEIKVGVADESVATLELDSTTTVTSVAMLELEAILVVDVPVEMLELEVTVVVDVPLVVPRGGGLEPGVAGGTIGNVVFRAGHPEDPASRRTGQ